MPNRTAKSVSAIFASVLASAPLTTISHGGTVAADNCLSAPKGDTPSGSHWYYRIEHSTKRHCWYLREEGDGLSQAAPLNISPSAKPPPARAEPTTQPSVVDARAELPAQTNRNAEPNTAWPALAPGLGDTPRAVGPDKNAASTVVASRWPESSGVTSASSPRPARSNLAANVPANPVAAPVVAVPLAAADSSSKGQPGLIPKLFVAAVGALALFSIAASLISKFSRARRPRRAAIRARQRPVWESTDDDRIVLSDYREADFLPRRTTFARGVGEANQPGGRTDFLSRISRRAPA
jgi:hypothetical protein